MIHAKIEAVVKDRLTTHQNLATVGGTLSFPKFQLYPFTTPIAVTPSLAAEPLTPY